MREFEIGLYLRVEEMDSGPKPLPLRSGFSKDRAYRALGIYNPSETSDAYFVLSNDRDEVWFICNRHLRTVLLAPEQKAFHFPIGEALAESTILCINI